MATCIITRTYINQEEIKSCRAATLSERRAVYVSAANNARQKNLISSSARARERERTIKGGASPRYFIYLPSAARRAAKSDYP